MKNKNKKSFTLLEMMISIALFSIILIFLYQSLDMTEKSNTFYSSKLSDFSKRNDIKVLFYEDLLNANIDKSTIVKDKEDNSIFTFSSSNTFHNNFYTNITYFLTKEKNLVRAESKKTFNKNKIHEFYDHSYIDIVLSNVEKFKVSKGLKSKKTSFIFLEFIDGKELVFSVKSFQ